MYFNPHPKNNTVEINGRIGRIVEVRGGKVIIEMPSGAVLYVRREQIENQIIN